jgi:hypothetical protein
MRQSKRDDVYDIQVYIIVYVEITTPPNSKKP